MKKIFGVILLKYLLLTNVLNSTLFAQAFKTYEQAIPGSELTFKMVPIPGGSFIMGSPGGEQGRSKDEGPQKRIIVSSFWMEEKEVTLAEWNIFIKTAPFYVQNDVDGVSSATTNDNDFNERDPYPASNMSQLAALMYCKWLYEKTGIFFRLPTEAEWEHACRAGNSAAYPFGNDPSRLEEYGYFSYNSGDSLHKAMELKPNAWGLYDMMGNLSEWTLDGYIENGYERTKIKDPLTIPTRRFPRVARGGSYLDTEEDLRCANRIPSEPSWNRHDPKTSESGWWLSDAPFIGFRIVRPLRPPPKEEIDKFFAAFFIQKR